MELLIPDRAIQALLEEIKSLQDTIKSVQQQLLIERVAAVSVIILLLCYIYFLNTLTVL